MGTRQNRGTKRNRANPTEDKEAVIGCTGCDRPLVECEADPCAAGHLRTRCYEQGLKIDELTKDNEANRAIADEMTRDRDYFIQRLALPADAAVLEYQRDVLRLIAKQVDATAWPLIERLGEAHAALLKAEAYLGRPIFKVEGGDTEMLDAMRRAALDDVRGVMENIESEQWWEKGE